MHKEALIKSVSSAHQTTFSAPSEYTSVAPARVNIIGEHTDYNDGFVLPVAIDFYTCVAASSTNENTVRVSALDYDESDQFEPNVKNIEKSPTFWKNFVRGAFQILSGDGHTIGGCNLTISGNIPKGAGLSSSASLEVALLSVLNDMFELGLSKLDMALLGQKIENEYVGLSCGIMDQLSVACGRDSRAILIDCKDHSIKTVDIPTSLSIMIVNSNVKRELTTSGYNDRRNECIKATKIMNINSLRELSFSQFSSWQDKLPNITSKRTKHVVTENQRVLDTVIAFKNNDIKRISNLMLESHLSMQNDYEITVPEIDYLVNILSDVIGANGGVRMTGGGFGGCVVALLPQKLVSPAVAAVEEKYRAKTGIEPSIYTCKPTGGVYSYSQIPTN